MWYIDGYHAVLAEKSHISSSFRHLSITNRLLCTTFIENEEQRNFFSRSSPSSLAWSWEEFKPSVVELCDSIASYVDYLAMKNKKDKLFICLQLQLVKIDDLNSFHHPLKPAAFLTCCIQSMIASVKSKIYIHLPTGLCLSGSNNKSFRGSSTQRLQREKRNTLAETDLKR